MKPSIDPNGGGVHVQSQTTLNAGDQIVSCNAAAVALEPAHRHLCAYCIHPCLPMSGSTTKEQASARCDKCFLVSICLACTAKGCKTWHTESGECKVLSSLVCANACHIHHNATVDESEEEKTNRPAQVTLEMANDVDSTYVLALRLMHRRWSEGNMNHLASPLPSMKWALLDKLYRAELRNINDGAMSELCMSISKSFGSMKGDNEDDQVKSMDGTWIDLLNFQDMLGKVIGCSHAVTDLTAPLGCQYIGRALFLEHSFYNHSCTPNSFLSCDISVRIGIDNDHIAADVGESKDHQLKNRSHQCALNARLHCIHDVKEGESVTISYIPTSGLSRDERRLRLGQCYDFICNCEACELKTLSAIEMDGVLKVPDNSDVECIRQMQFSCNQQLLEIQHSSYGTSTRGNMSDLTDVQLTELESCIATINMNRRGIHFQGIPASHEISIESHRLLAKALSMYGEIDEALEEYKSFRKAVQPIMKLFDPVAFATTLLEFGVDLQRTGIKCKEEASSKAILTDALEFVTTALGEEHTLVLRIKDGIDGAGAGAGASSTLGHGRITTKRATKRQKIET